MLSKTVKLLEAKKKWHSPRTKGKQNGESLPSEQQLTAIG